MIFVHLDRAFPYFSARLNWRFMELWKKMRGIGKRQKVALKPSSLILTIYYLMHFFLSWDFYLSMQLCSININFWFLWRYLRIKALRVVSDTFCNPLIQKILQNHFCPLWRGTLPRLSEIICKSGLDWLC